MHHELGAVERLRRGVVEVEVERHLLLHQRLHRAPHGSRIHRAGRLAGVDAVRPILAQILLRRLHHHLLSHRRRMRQTHAVGIAYDDAAMRWGRVAHLERSAARERTHSHRLPCVAHAEEHVARGERRRVGHEIRRSFQPAEADPCGGCKNKKGAPPHY